MFGIDLIDAGLLPAMIVAAVAGLLSFLSPCVLPIVPPYLAYMSGVSLNDLNDGSRRSSAVLPAFFFVLGLSTVFLILGFAASGPWVGFCDLSILFQCGCGDFGYDFWGAFCGHLSDWLSGS